MQRKSRTPNPVPRPRAGKSAPLKIVVVYDGFSDLIRAHEMWSEVAAQLKHEIQVVSSVWNFALLRDPWQRQKAARKTADANMLVLSAGGHSELPDHARHWFSSWMPWKNGRRDALVAVLDKQTPPSANANRLCDFLRQIAKQTGMDFFCNTGGGRMCLEAPAGV